MIFNGMPPIEPSASIRESANAQMAMVNAYVEAGFEREEAVFLIGQMMLGAGIGSTAPGQE